MGSTEKESNERANEIIVDVVDTYLNKMVIHRARRYNYWDILDQYYGMLSPEDQSRFGKRYRLAQILAVACSLDPYESSDLEELREHHMAAKAAVAEEGGGGGGEEEEEEKTEGEEEETSLDDSDMTKLPMAHWSPQHWDALGGLIESLQLELRVRQQDSKVSRIQSTILIQKGISGFRRSLEEQIKSRNRNEKPDVSPEQIKDLVQMVEQDSRDEVANAALRSLLSHDTEELEGDNQPMQLRKKSPSSKKRTERSARNLKDISDLEMVLNSKPFELTYVQRKLEWLVYAWLEKLHPAAFEEGHEVDMHESSLPSTTADRRVVASIDHPERGELPSHKSKGTGKDRGFEHEDDLEQTKPAAQLSGRSGKGHGTKRKSQATHDDLDDDERLPTILPNGRRKRMKFTETEKNCIREGVKQFGFGKWSQIKSKYASELRNRTNVNIKDCYRTMMRKNEV